MMASVDQVCNVEGMWRPTAPIIIEEEKGEPQITDQKQHGDPDVEDPGDGLDGCSSDGCDDDKSCRDEEDYYAFLREMAGSFEATYDDEDESDDGSETDAEVEENDQPGSRKRSSSFWLDPRPVISSASASGPEARVTQQIEAENGSKDSTNKAIQMTSGKDSVGTGGYKAVSGQLGELPSKVLQGTARPGSALTGYSTSSGSGESNLSEYSDDEDARSEASDDDSRPLVPTPSHDHRPPVEDDYDVVEATKQFASQRTADPKQQQRQDLQSMIDIKSSQVKQLQRTSKKPHTKLELSAHYAKVCEEIEAEVAELRKSLEALA